MIERASEFSPSAAMPLVPDPPSGELSAGQMLRQAREAHGLHLDVVAAALKVPTQKLAALEADQIDALPDPVFARALAASMCRALRVDPAPVLEKLPGAPRAVLAEADRTMSGNIRPQAQRSSVRAGLTGGPSRPLLAVVGLLLVGALVIYFLPQSATESMSAAWTRLTGGGAQEAADEDSRPPEGMVAETPQPAPVAAPAPAAPPVAAASAAAVPAADAPPAADSVPAAPVSTPEVLVFKARGESWIRVTGTGGRTVFERTLKDGETASVPQADLPLAVTVGRAAVVEVQVQGQAFDLAPITRSGGVARFEVKP
ncbi:RodZ domain-containing protein [Xenophilus sp. Marseille-Q4582]|uniref:helix-turn-helix domain-containing protein n=1 Tax=Xenophilus sp. Marseille-Q4582 TaxID=2866600 RepID=UPI001CE45D3B|nr:RodZ domain-containing protein [Xenophilus sp. Marseille-Q4582]